MAAKIIPFNEAIRKLMEEAETVEPIKCSFCTASTTQALSSGDNTKHICPKCMVKCADLMKE